MKFIKKPLNPLREIKEKSFLIYIIDPIILIYNTSRGAIRNYFL
jgi:hypothetical protein